MVNNSRVQALCDKLRSHKIQERTQGISNVRIVFSDPHVIQEIKRYNSNDWTLVFKALFTTIRTERDLVNTKGSKTASNRLEGAIGALRWLVEQRVTLFTYKDVHSICENAPRLLISNGKLFLPVAFDYIKILRCLLSWPPHLSYLPSEQWVELVQLGFNVLLEKDLTLSLSQDNWESHDGSRARSNSGEGEEYADASTGEKRRRREQRTPQPNKAKPPMNWKVSLEQTEFAALLSVLLGSPAAPFHREEYKDLSSAVLTRLHRFLHAFPSDSSLVNEYLSMVSSTLSHVSFNNKALVEKFAHRSWGRLLSIWGVKDRRLKEELVAIIRTLLPFVASNMDDDNVRESSTYAALMDLYNKLVSDADNKWGNDCLSLEAIRLEVASGVQENQPFVAKTFRAGSNFDQGNALGWAILQLHADVAAKLYELSENGPHQTQINKSGLEKNPLNSLLHNMIPSTTSSRPYRFQLLLFLIDHHWNRFHSGLKQEIINTLLQYISIDDSTIQSWVFLVLAAITFSENQEKPVKPNIPSVAQLLDANIWASIWTHAIRRVCIPNLCRAASHAAHVVIISVCNQSNPSSSALPPQDVLPDIEALAKDIYFQGPSYPYDSVCSFLSDCLTTASQDVRLYRMGFEDKVLSWLVDNWKGATASKDKLALNDIQDVLLLLQTVCGLRSGHAVKTRILTPECCVSDQMSMEMKTEVIRDYVLGAHLSQVEQHVPKQPLDSSTEEVAKVEMGLPRSRERKVKAFFSRTLESVLDEWYSENIHPTAEKARVALDFAVVALIFEAQLIMNGTEADRTVLKYSAKLISAIIPFLKGSRWSWSEKAMVLLGLEPLVSLDDCPPTSNLQPWTALLQPGADSGIRSRVLEASRTDKGSNLSDNADILRVIWRHSDVREFFDATIASMREILSGILQGDKDAMDIDSQDDFSMVESAVSQKMIYSGQVNADDIHFLQYVAKVCIMFITTGPFLQSTSEDPVRDLSLTTLVLGSSQSRRKIFLLLSPLLFTQVKRKILHLTGSTLIDFLMEFGDILQNDYEYQKSAPLQTLVISILDDVLDIWASDLPDIEYVREKIAILYMWAARMYEKNNMSAWTSRDAFARFLAHYIQREPTAKALTEVKEKYLPSVLLPKMNFDTDIRVRFRAAVLNARLLEKAYELQSNPVDIYDSIKRSLATNTSDYEYMITRFLCLGNIMINNSSVRRGAYWHLVEIFYYTSEYAMHIKAVLEGVAHRLGLPNLSTFCETYSTQLAWSLRDLGKGKEQESGSSLFKFPPKLLGYKDARQCAEMTLRAFTPSYLVDEKEAFFEDHCLRSGRDSNHSLRDIFPDIVGLKVLLGFEDNTNADDWESQLQKVTFKGDEFEENLRQNVDGIITYMLPTLFEPPSSNGDPVVEALKSSSWDRKAADIFSSLLRYQDAGTNYLPNLPNYSANVVLSGILWLTKRLPGSVTPATTFHVLHELLARIHRSPFVNEQLRLTKAFCLWIAIQATHFQDGTLLYTLTHGAVALMAQPDLAKSAQSILEWAFSCYRKYGIKDARLSGILLRIACTAHDYAAGKSGDTNMHLGKSLMEWIDAQTVHFWETTLKSPNPSLKSSIESLIHRALAAWPYKLPSSLLGLCQGITFDSLSKALGDSRISSEKFGLVRRLREYKLKNDYDSERFFNFDFWRIKECIPSDDRMEIDDIDAFIALLELNHGQFSSFSTDQRASESIRDIHRLASRRKSSLGVIMDETPRARDCVISALLKMLQRDTESQVYTAYSTLRLIMAAVPPDTRLSIRVLPEQPKELEYLREYRRFPRPAVDHDILHELERDTYIESIVDFPKWIRLITTLLSDCLSVVDPVFSQLNQILGTDVTFAEDIFPVLVHELLLEKNFEDTSANNRSALSRYFSSVLSAQECSVQCLRCIIDTVLHLRYFAPGNGSALAYNNWLDVNYMLLARSAIICGAYTTALLFLELAADQDSPVNESSREEILYEIYAHIDEPDGFYGIITDDLQKFLVKRLHHEQQWDKAFRYHGAVLEAGQSSADEDDGLIRSFHSFGFDRLAIDTLQCSSRKTDNSGLPSSMTYRLGWRTETWDLPAQIPYTSGASIYQCLRAVYRERDQNTVDSTIRQALYREMSRLRDLGPENVIEIRQVTQDLMCIHQIYQWRHMEKNGPGKDQRDLSSSLRDEFLNIDSAFEFSDLENIMATRISLVRSARQKEEKQQIGNLVTPFTRSLIDIEKLSLLRLSEAARKTNHVQIAFNAVVRAQGLEKKKSSFDTSHEFAHVLWLQKEEKLSVQYLLNIVKQDDNKVTSEISRVKKASLLSRLGSWASEACLNNANDIWNRYFGRAISTLESAVESTADQQAHAAVYHECAIFASRQYHAIVKSPDVLRWKLYVQRKRQEIDNLKKAMRRTPSQVLQSNIQKVSKELDADNEMSTKYALARNTFLKQAIEMYSRCLHNSDKFDNDAAIRLCSLWFANFDDEEQVLEDTIPSALARVASGKMVFLAHQLTARLSTSKSVNQSSLQTLILRMCTDHPFHSLYQLFCLWPNCLSGDLPSQPRQPRAEAAASIFSRLRADSTCKQRVIDVQYLCDVYLKWAKFRIKGKSPYQKRKPSGFKIPDDMKIRTLSNLQVPVSTRDLPVDRTMRYDNCVWITGYEPTFDTAGGVNVPKICVCLGSDGNKYKQLFKGEGNDDLRQDAVMEQVFRLVNTVLQQNRETKRRKLTIREYKVIPLDTQAGLLEFVGNTTPLRSWLEKAHQRYRPNDWKPSNCSDKMIACSKLGPGKQLAAFKEIQENFKPVMRHYFTEKHKGPISWFSMRLSYVRSVATTSIVGHVLGLGDRHTSNILLDNSSGEVVHIDLGIAFDQGKLLPVPERVPFRMTADMVDGMGISGTHGVFGRCAEETLRVLREGSEVIMTVLEVFKHDPLHSWVASDNKIRQAQGLKDEPGREIANDVALLARPLGIGIDMNSNSTAEAADRALSSVARKLDKTLTVETVVNELTAEATDLNNLATIYFGWGPYY